MSARSWWKPSGSGGARSGWSTVCATLPPRVEYELTEFGRTLLVPLEVLAAWAATHRGNLQAARARYDRQSAHGSASTRLAAMQEIAGEAH
ncbi:winged helix-turn-helix transcriptional regulator [Amycolatopsis bartoniae]|uniref:winged helix-turn-helix transcriptional regulator n=1 Tax=Amycolatopsis bartoniae TaxID=941986 RepID=UPI003570E092